MALILNLETTTKVCSVAITRNGEVMALTESNDADYGHAEKLHVYIEESLKRENIKYSDLDAIAVAGGPGSYTGLRIGVSAAKGFCFGLSKPLIAVDPLKALALNFVSGNQIEADSLVFPMIDARRDEVFMSVFKHDLKQLETTSAQIITADFFDKYPTESCYLIGDGSAKFNTLFEGNNKIKIITDCLASAAPIGKLAEELYARKEFVDIAYYEPFYGKEFQTTVSTKLNKIRTSN